ncbi:hypothetical protein HYW30_01765 [Candidatus Azambacteria bacterium]|nr:hypothetical protein [Candidatus Azambacteria bacterium]
MGRGIIALIRDTISFLSILGALLLDGGLWLYLKTNVKESPLPYTLHYNVFSGIDVLGEERRIFFLPLFGLILIILNTAGGAWLFERSPLLSRLAVGVLPLFAAALFAAGFLLVQANR